MYLQLEILDYFAWIRDCSEDGNHVLVGFPCNRCVCICVLLSVHVIDSNFSWKFPLFYIHMIYEFISFLF